METGPDIHSRNAVQQLDPVAEANLRFYDQIASIYDSVDSRRDGKVDHHWLYRQLLWLQDLASNELSKPKDQLSLLDAGTGSGFLGKMAAALFPRLTLMDLSQKMLDRIDCPTARKIQGDCSHIPLENQSTDVVAAFATLHHLFSPQEFFREAHRILVPGGLLYTDHDIEAQFVRWFHLPLKLYRKKFDHGHGYLSACPDAKKEDYFLSEYHGQKGLSGPELCSQLRRLGFVIRKETYHWDGMGTPAALIERSGLKRMTRRRGLAPILRIVAQKNF